MNRIRLASVLLGAAFGFLLSWGRFTDPDLIRDMLLLEDPYLYLMMGSCVAVAFTGLHLLRRRGARAVITGDEIALPTQRPERRHVVGASIFGLGWAVANTCPGPVTAQLGQGFGWSLVTGAGIVAGVLLYFAVERRSSLETEPAEPVPQLAYASAPD